ncbi:MAG: hypothetical protein WCH65_05495 [bacterium]
MKKKIFFLYLQAGGGHISTARAIAKYMEQHHESIEPVLIDGFTEAPSWLKKIVIDGYKTSQTKGQRVYELLYRIHKRWLAAKISQVGISWLLQKYIKKALLQYDPSHVVVLHFFLVRPVVHAIKARAKPIPVTTIITDPFTLHPLRSLDKYMEYVVFSERAKNIVLKR